MSNQKKLLIAIGVLMLIFVFAVQSIQSTNVGISEVNEDLPFLLDDGTLMFYQWDYIRREAASDPNGIEWVVNISLIEQITITSLSDSLVKFEKTYLVVVNEAYQIYDSLYYYEEYYPTHFTLVFKDEFGYEIATIPYMTFELTRIVNTATGERIFTNNPYDAHSVYLAVHYDYSFYGYTTTSKYICGFADDGSYSNVFDPNAAIWQIGSVIDDYNVTQCGTWKGYDTWILEGEELENFSIQYEYEQTSGLLIGQYYQYIDIDNYYREKSRWIYGIGETIFEIETVIVTETITITVIVTETIAETVTTTESTSSSKKTSFGFLSLSTLVAGIIVVWIRRRTHR